MRSAFPIDAQWRYSKALPICLLLVSVLIHAPLVGATSAPDKPVTHEYHLDNGMQVLVREDHRSPVVVSQVWYRVGSSYEINGQTGLSHVLEHMMFKGTARHGPGEFSRIIAANGGRENAFTGQDYTAYFQTLAADRLAIALELEADRMRNLLLPADEFAKELQVVIEERRMRTEDSPGGMLYEQFQAAAYVNSPYHHPVIGWMNDLENLRRDDLKAWYDRWYQPNNATLVVAGDVTGKAVLALAKKYFGPIPAARVVPPRPQQEIRQLGERRLVVKVPAEVPQLLMGYHVPVLTSIAAPGADGIGQQAGDPSQVAPWEPYALDLLAGVLDGGESARLVSRLRRGKALAAAVGAGYRSAMRATGLFTLSATPATGHSSGELEQALRDEIAALRDQQVSPAELKRAKRQVVAQEVYGKDSVFYQAMQLGMLETVGADWRLLDEYLTRINSVTAEQIQAVARKYLVADNLTVATLVPLPIKAGRVTRNSLPGGDHVR